MNGKKSALLLLAVGILAVGGFWFGMRKAAIASPPAPVAPPTHPVAAPPTAPAAPMEQKKTFTVEARHGMTWQLNAPPDKPHGWMTGHWRSRGKSAGVDGAADDSLIAFKIVGPDDTVVEQKKDHPIFGNFKLRFDGPGAYTLIFDNGGVIRSSARVVEVEAAYQPD